MHEWLPPHHDGARPPEVPTMRTPSVLGVKYVGGEWHLVQHIPASVAHLIHSLGFCAPPCRRAAP